MANTGTTYCRKIFSGIPKSSRWKNRPKMLASAAIIRMAMRSSNSKPSQVTRVPRFRGTDVVFSAKNDLLAHACRPIRNEELCQPGESRTHQAQHRSHEMPSRRHEGTVRIVRRRAEL